MTSSTYDGSIQDGELVELFKFFVGSAAWRLTSLDKSYIYQGEVYSSATIVRGDIVRSTNLDKQNIPIYIPKDHPVSQLFNEFPPGGVIGVAILQGHANDPDQEFLGIFSGRVLGAISKPGFVELTCEPASTSQRKVGLSRKYQVSCPYTLYDSGCKLNRVDFVTTLTVAAVDGATVTLTGAGGLGDDYLTGGYAAWSVGTDYLDFRPIEGHVGDIITFMFPASNLQIGQSISVYPGCNFTSDQCKLKFSNYINYGGFPYHPDREPFSGENVF